MVSSFEGVEFDRGGRALPDLPASCAAELDGFLDELRQCVAGVPVPRS
jgi:hypothetical protein